MEKQIKCKNCNEDIIVIENKLFFSEEKSETSIECPICYNVLENLSTDGWFFVQTKKEHLKENKIKQSKEKLTFPMP
ncbi:conserved hypothetical protein [Tenacibaculum litoreum]|uniref:hypothetical protein n=1 Tax=Tenacibaculum litoreum TaxID=321269 RepID=UPI0038934D66